MLSFKVMGCTIPKVASTSIHRTFNKLRVRLDGAYNHDFKINSLEKLQQNRTQYKTFIIVREPMERLASCYNDKFIVNLNSELEIWRKKIKINAIRILGETLTSYNTSQVSFKEFLVGGVLHGPNNKHWNPYYELCAPCIMNYDFIGRIDEINVIIK